MNEFPLKEENYIEKGNKLSLVASVEMSNLSFCMLQVMHL